MITNNFIQVVQPISSDTISSSISIDVPINDELNLSYSNIINHDIDDDIVDEIIEHSVESPSSPSDSDSEYIASEDNGDNGNSGSEDDDQQNRIHEEYEVESLLKMKMINGKTNYLVKWIGFKKPTWEETSNLIGYQDLIREFKSSEIDHYQSISSPHQCTR